MQTKNHQLTIFIGGFLLFLIDRFLKYLSLNICLKENYLTKMLGWHPFKNTGIAFSLPLPNYLTISISIPILFLIGYFLYQDYKQQRDRVFVGLTVLFFGALSNFYDRLYYQATIDYWLIGTGVINLADIMIVAGFYFLFKKRQKYSVF